MDEKIFDVIIIGSGPAGLTAGIYTSRAALSTLIIAGEVWGGQLMQTTEVENYPGFPEGIMGPDLMMNIRKQAERFGAEIIEINARKAEKNDKTFRVNTTDGTFEGRAIIAATGAEFKWLGLPNEQRLIGRGVSACATCDAAFFKNKKVIVVGGGDAAMEEAQVLAKFASEVTIVHRRDCFRASKIMQEKVFANPKIKVIWCKQVADVLGENKVEGVKLDSGEVLEAEGMFVAIGHNPATKIFEGLLELDDKGFIKKVKTGEMRNEMGEKIGYMYNMMTSVPGIFTAGDVHDLKYKQAITAAGYGCEAALETEKWLEENSAKFNK